MNKETRFEDEFLENRFNIDVNLIDFCNIYVSSSYSKINKLFYYRSQAAARQYIKDAAAPEIYLAAAIPLP
jgi:hypothetical protein